jgi:host factor-I protein
MMPLPGARRLAAPEACKHGVGQRFRNRFRALRCGAPVVVLSLGIKPGKRNESNGAAPLPRVATVNHNVFKGWHPVEAVNRKLIRPSLNEIKEQIPPPRRAPQAQKKAVPPDQTNAENFYYVKQMQAKTPMVFVLRDGETLHGVIEWYDKSCLKVNRTGEPNILLYKPCIKYMYKEG